MLQQNKCFDVYDVGSVCTTGKEITRTKSSREPTLYTVELFVSSPLAMVQQNMQCMDHRKAGNIKKTSVCKASVETEELVHVCMQVMNASVCSSFLKASL